jgi:hypothetical protein
MQVINKNDKQEKRRNQENSFGKYLAYTYLENSNRTKYDSLMNNLKQQQSLKHNQYPKTNADASNELNSHKFDNLGRKIGEKNKDNTEKSKIHDGKSDLPELSFAQMEGRCFCCDKTGHKSPECNDKRKKEEWYIKKVKKSEIQKGTSTCKPFTIGEYEHTPKVPEKVKYFLATQIGPILTYNYIKLKK